MTTAALVDFPATDARPPSAYNYSPDRHSQSHLPFRRISLPTPPNLLHRQSVVSTASFDSLAEEGPPLASFMTVNKGANNSPRHRLTSIEGGRRGGRRREPKVLDDQREAKRRKIIDEFYETEKSYVDGLELIYSHFLTPIVASLDTSHPLLDRNELTSVFSNFIDIWNLHRSFYSSLTTYLQSSSSNTSEHSGPPPLSPILQSHFPYLSLYTLFVTSFPDLLSSYSSLLSKNPAFASFITQQESDPRCGKLKLRDWLLTIVQRCPRYLLLLKDLIGCTHPDNPEYVALTSVHALVSKITISLNTSLHTHAQTLSILSLQRSTANLPFQLISPGRIFQKRSTLLQVEGSFPKEREFLLFSDCVIWLANADRTDDAELSFTWESDIIARSPIYGTTGHGQDEPRKDVQHHELPKRKESLLKLKIGGSPRKKARHASNGTEERWIYKGHINLVDLEVVVTPYREPGDDQRFEILSPQSSFALYAASGEDRDQWCESIRSAKASLMSSLNAIHPNSTLTSSASTHHLRRTLQALPYSPDEEGTQPMRSKVDHFVPPVWVPDAKTDGCMRCGKTFGWRRRRHHCRLCGRCVCSKCSGKTFYIHDSTSEDSHKPSRACNACYDTVFPIIDTTILPPTNTSTIAHLTLSGLKSMPSFLPSENNLSSPSVLMAFDLESPRRPFSRLEDHSPSPSRSHRDRDPSDDSPPVAAVRFKPTARPRSYVQILEDFNGHRLDVEEGTPSPIIGSPCTSRFSHHTRHDQVSIAKEEVIEQTVQVNSSLALDVEGGSGVGGRVRSVPASPRKEDTARRHKRFSLPAVALQTTSVTTRPNAFGEGKSKRFSLVLGKSSSSSKDSGNGIFHGVAAGKLSELLRRDKAPS
ncbi:hypothetical protein ABKN59_011364 [Abortiporus biennis]